MVWFLWEFVAAFVISLLALEAMREGANEITPNNQVSPTLFESHSTSSIAI